jgi:hypothetical protein
MTMAVIMILIFWSSASACSLQPPDLSLAFESHSARTYMNLEREFMKEYLFDMTYGGTYFALDGKGNVLDSTKNIIFQTNVILLLAGMNSQSPDPDVSRFIDSAAGFVAKYLKWGTEGTGTWYYWSNRSGGDPHRMDWPAPSEAYVSYGLLWAYRITGNQTYLEVARTNLNYQMSNFPDGHILYFPRDVLTHAGDVTYRSPERMTYYSMRQLTGNTSYLDYARRIERATAGRNGWEPDRANQNGTIVKGGPHSSAIVDEVLFALASGDETALDEGRQLFAKYEAGGYSARDNYQDFLVMDLALWTITQNTTYRDDAIRVYNRLLELWDSSPPYGFWATVEKLTKTCFSRGYPLVDMTPPVIEADPEGQKVSAKIVDPNFKWLNLTYAGIGVNPSSVYLFYSLDGHNWIGAMRMQSSGGDTYTALVPQDVAVRNPLYMISASDYFNNTSIVEFRKPQITAPTIVASVTSTTASVVATSMISTSASIVASSTTSTTMPSVPVLVTPIGSLNPGLAVIALAALISGALIAVIALMYRRRPVPPAGYSVWRCPYCWECYRRHGDSLSCNEMRASGHCYMYIPEGLRPGQSNHTPPDYRPRY